MTTKALPPLERAELMRSIPIKTIGGKFELVINEMNDARQELERDGYGNILVDYEYEGEYDSVTT